MLPPLGYSFFAQSASTRCACDSAVWANGALLPRVSGGYDDAAVRSELAICVPPAVASVPRHTHLTVLANALSLGSSGGSGRSVVFCEERSQNEIRADLHLADAIAANEAPYFVSRRMMLLNDDYIRSEWYYRSRDLCRSKQHVR